MPLIWHNCPNKYPGRQGFLFDFGRDKDLIVSQSRINRR
ncbi:MAG: hypothetical protein ACJAVM_003176 [Sulfitobacter sp.]|jgi:hypothetical protein